VAGSDTSSPGIPAGAVASAGVDSDDVADNVVDVDCNNDVDTDVVGVNVVDDPRAVVASAVTSVTEFAVGWAESEAHAAVTTTNAIDAAVRGRCELPGRVDVLPLRAVHLTEDRFDDAVDR
jgi:hypothetical protein